MIYIIFNFMEFWKKVIHIFHKVFNSFVGTVSPVFIQFPAVFHNSMKPVSPVDQKKNDIDIKLFSFILSLFSQQFFKRAALDRPAGC